MTHFEQLDAIRREADYVAKYSTDDRLASLISRLAAIMQAQLAEDARPPKPIQPPIVLLTKEGTSRPKPAPSPE